MSDRQDTPAARSIRQRLLNRSREKGEDYPLLLTRFGIERFLYRLSRSVHRNRFILKGAMLFAAWTDNAYRPTRDLDLLSFGHSTANDLVEACAGICAQPVEEDGLDFDAESISARNIREDQVYGGTRIRLLCHLGKTRISLQIDVGIGDAVTPGPQDIDFPTVLGHPAPRLRAYPVESVISEKLEAIVTLGIGNSRMKDFYDLWVLGRRFAPAEALVSSAIVATFSRRQTPRPDGVPVGLSDGFADDPLKQTQWNAFLDGLNVQQRPGLREVIAELRSKYLPLLRNA